MNFWDGRPAKPSVRPSRFCVPNLLKNRRWQGPLCSTYILIAAIDFVLIGVSNYYILWLDLWRVRGSRCGKIRLTWPVARSPQCGADGCILHPILVPTSGLRAKTLAVLTLPASGPKLDPKLRVRIRCAERNYASPRGCGKHPAPNLSPSVNLIWAETGGRGYISRFPVHLCTSSISAISKMTVNHKFGVISRFPFSVQPTCTGMHMRSDLNLQSPGGPNPQLSRSLTRGPALDQACTFQVAAANKADPAPKGTYKEHLPRKSIQKCTLQAALTERLPVPYFFGWSPFYKVVVDFAQIR